MTAISEMTDAGMGDLPKDAELAMKAGVDMDMVSETYLKYLPELVARGEIPESMINQACRRILEAKYKLGLFADPYRGCTEERARAEILTPENRKVRAGTGGTIVRAAEERRADPAPEEIRDHCVGWSAGG